MEFNSAMPWRDLSLIDLIEWTDRAYLQRQAKIKAQEAQQ